MECYGNHSSTDACKACDLASYCAESAAIDNKQSGCYNYEDVAYGITAKEETPSNEPAKLLGELLYALHDQPDKMSSIIQMLHYVCEIYHNNPMGFSITLTKLLNPEMNYTQIGERHNTSKQLVDYYLKRSVKIVPILSRAILVDRRRVAISLTPRHNHLPLADINGSIHDAMVDHSGSICAFSKISGIDRGSLYKIIKGGRRPRKKIRDRLCKTLEIEPLELKLRFGI